MQDPIAPPSADQLQQLNVLLGQIVQFTSHISTGAMTAHAIQWFKGMGWFGTLWDSLSDRGKVIFGAIAAALPAAGITVTFHHPAAGHYLLDVQNLTVATGVAFVWSLLQNWVFQQGWYQAVIKPKPVVGPVVPATPVAVEVKP